MKGSENMANNEISISQKLFSTDRMNMSAFMYLPSAYLAYTNAYSLRMSPIITIRWTAPVNAPEELRFAKDGMYKITPRNIYRTIKFFNSIVKWFYDEDMKDLFVQGENGKLLFNPDYSKLCVSTKPDPFSDSVMKATPAVIRYETGQEYEGIYLYINKNEFIIPLILSDIEDILGILSTFSFEGAASSMLLGFMHSKSAGRVYDKPYAASNRMNSPSQSQWEK